MKRLILTALICLLSSPVLGGTWCKRSESNPDIGVNCKDTGSSGVFQLPSGAYVAEKDYNEYSYYEKITTEPEVLADQVKDAETWRFDVPTSTFDYSWDVRDLTPQEVIDRDDQVLTNAEEMGRFGYYLLNSLLKPGAIKTDGSLNPAVFPSAFINAYQAWGRLEAQ